MNHHPLPPLVRIISFGYLHSAPPDGAHLVVDLRHHFRDPHHDPAFRHLTSSNPRVRGRVLSTPGIRDLIDAITRAATAMASGPGQDDVLVAIGCSGGRHRAPTVARAIVERLEEAEIDVQLVSWHTTRPVVDRTEEDPC